MKHSYKIGACSGRSFDVKEGQIVTITDSEGGQVADFFAETAADPEEFLSPAVTIDCNESLKLKIGSIIYTNLYRPMFELLEDDSGEHDLIHPCCRREMYDFFYQNGENHPSCFDNISSGMNKKHHIISPINFFMNTRINTDGSFSVEPPVSKPGDKVVLRALTDARIGVAACSVSESRCNSGVCSPVEAVIDDPAV